MAKKITDASAASQSMIGPSNFAVAEAYANIAGIVYGVMNMDDEQMQELERLGDGIRDVMWALKSARKGRDADNSADGLRPSNFAPVLAEGKPEPKKTRIADCRDCWCDDCADIETCQRHIEGVTPDTFGPMPCAGCKDGMRFKPKGKEPGCEYRPGEGQNYG